MPAQTKPAFLPWYKWYPRDFSASEEAAALTLAEEGAVRRLLDHQWIQGSIPADMEQLADLCRVSAKQMAKLWQRAGRFFAPTDAPSRLCNAGLKSQYESVVQEKELLSAAGHRGAQARWGRHDAPKREAKTSASHGRGRRKAEAEAEAEKPSRGVGMFIFSELRKARACDLTPNGPRYHLPREYIESLGEATRRAIEGVGGPHIIASAEDDKLPVLRAHFADMYVAAVAAGGATEK